MQRRRFLSYLLLAPAAPTFLVGGLSVLSGCGKKVASCLVKFSDPVLGKAAVNKRLGRKLPDAWLQACEAELSESVRQAAARDFSQQKTRQLDGWIVSETEALIHRAGFLNTDLSVSPKP